jgi:class 3 adenylate cyclase/predicted ATPase
VAREQRKTVTVLFCDVTGSTELGERLDPEALRSLLARYFARMKATVERHGGTVEKFIGDAVMAVFGVPIVHEDDALRALRAAVEMRESFPALGIEGRIGVTTGEVVTGTEERLATGDAVNVAARLEQSARPGEILVGEETLQLARDAVEVELAGPLVLKGKAEPVAAYRLLGVHGAEGSVRHLEAPMVGRERELDRTRDAFDQAVDGRSCQLFTILGAAGVGKSRLASEFLGSLKDTLVVRGRCLPYGEGITYWPVVEVVKQLPGLQLEGGAAAALRALLGEETQATSSEEIAWAFRKLLEAVAEETPLVCVFDDVHWGEETFLDLVEHVADLARDAPILLLCMARPELLDRRTGWAGGKVNATSVLLEPLDPEDTGLLIESLAHLDDDLRRRILEAAEGNPLFVEEMVALVQASGGGEVTVPPTIQALLAARLDQLDAPERGVLERGAVEGRIFHRGAVQALAPEEPQLMQRLSSLVRKELVRPDTTQLPGDDAFRFRHLLIRDAAYNSLPKSTRATLHERFADWLAEHGAALVELDEIVGYHLEQAVRYHAELGAAGDRLSELSRLAGLRLAAAGARALERDDKPGAINLLSRATELLPFDSPLRRHHMVDLGYALVDTGQLERGQGLFRKVIEESKAAGDDGAAARARVAMLFHELQGDPTRSQTQLLDEVRAQIHVLEQLGERAALAEAWEAAATLEGWLGRTAAAAPAYDEAEKHARASGQSRLLRRVQAIRVLQEAWGHRDTASGVERCNALLAETRGTSAEPVVLGARALYRSWRGEHSGARADIRRARSLLEEFGHELMAAASAMIEAQVELAAGDARATELAARAGYERLENMNETGWRSTLGCYLAEALYRQGSLDDAERIALEAISLASGDDVVSQARARTVRAKVLAHRRVAAEAGELAREAVELTSRTDYFAEQAEALCALAEVLTLLGRAEEAQPLLREAIALFERKGASAGVAATRRQLMA